MKDSRPWWGLLRKAVTEKTNSWILVMAVVGVALVVLSAMPGRTQKPAPADETLAYTQALESRLEDMVSSVQGAGQSKVMVTLEHTVEYVYANEEKVNSDRSQSDSGDVSSRDDSQKTVVTVDAQDGKQGLLVTEIQPTVRGVVIACEGAADEQVAQCVAQAVKTALNITDKRVCVIPYGSKGEMGQ